MSDIAFPDWRAMDPATLDAAYDNARSTTDAPGTVAAWAAASAALRAARPQGLDIPYGPLERQKWDLFPAAAPGAPCLVFIHGGYWQKNSRQGFSCMMEGAMALGWSAALPGYTLAPEASLTQIVDELRLALDMLAAEGPRHGIAGPVLLSGWSAGGHLAALLADHPLVKAALPISGIFDLEPIRGTTLNAKLDLTEAEIGTLSPQRLPPCPKPMSIAYGLRELPELQRQSRDFQAYRAAAGVPGRLLPVDGAEHFSVLEALRRPGGALLAELQSMLDN